MGCLFANKKILSTLAECPLSYTILQKHSLNLFISSNIHSKQDIMLIPCKNCSVLPSINQHGARSSAEFTEKCPGKVVTINSLFLLNHWNPSNLIVSKCLHFRFKLKYGICSLCNWGDFISSASCWSSDFLAAKRVKLLIYYGVHILYVWEFTEKVLTIILFLLNHNLLGTL